MARLLKTLLALLILSAIWDGLLTYLNLKTIGFGFEANPLVKGILTLTLVKLAVITIGIYLYKHYHELNFDNRYIITVTFLILTFGQLYGGYTHVPILIENRMAESIQVGNGSYTIYKPDGSFVSYETLQPAQRTQFYFRKIFAVMIWPMLFSILAFAITRKTSQDIQIKKVKFK